MIYRFLLFIFILLFCKSLFADPNNDQWKDTDRTYLELIQEGFEIKAYDMSNFKDSLGNMYMFFVTVLQKNKRVFECQEYQVFDNLMNTLDLTFVCRELVKPYKKGIET